jgi:hypothetical protein
MDADVCASVHVCRGTAACWILGQPAKHMDCIEYIHSTRFDARGTRVLGTETALYELTRVILWCSAEYWVVGCTAWTYTILVLYKYRPRVPRSQRSHPTAHLVLSSF